MKRPAILFCSLIVLSIVACTDNATEKTASSSSTDTSMVKGDSSGSESSAGPMDTTGMTAAMMAYATPGEVHKMLATQNGKWKEDMTCWMGEGGPAMKASMTCQNMMIMGGRYQQSKHSGTFENMPFEGMSTLGYDNKKQVFVSTWIDNMGTGIMYAEGPWDAASKSLTLHGKMVDPRNGKDIMVRQVMTFSDDTHQKMEMYNTFPGRSEYKSMEIMLTKQ